MDRITAQLRERGATILYQDRPAPAPAVGSAQHAVFFEDPDRIKIELVAP